MGKWISRGIAAVITVAIGIWVNYLAMPAWNIRSQGLWWFIFGMAVAAAIVFAIAEAITNDHDSFWTDFSCTGGTLIVAIIVLLSIAICALCSSEMFNANKYHNLIAFEEGKFDSDIPKVSENMQLSIVDVSTARKVGDRTTGNIKNAAWYEVDNEYNLIKYQGRYYRISELNYGGFWKYRKAKYSGIPGYVLVDVETQEAKYIELEEPIRYSPSGHFAYLLKRHLRDQYPSYMFSKSFFEIDDEGNAYYITGVERPTIGTFGGKKINSFIITNASTGENKEYKTEDLPEWVDHAYSLSYLMNIADYHQKYIKGYWNTTFLGAKTGINKTTYSYGGGYYNTAINANDEIVFYTGITPVNNTESNIGFVLANPRTGKITYYSCAGAEETSAQSAAQGLVQNLGYRATFPTILNVDGQETYFMLLKDSAGLVQRYALANIKDYTKVVQAEKFEEVLKLYREKLGTAQQDSKEETEKILKEGIIQEIYQAQIDGYTYYYFKIGGSTELYMSSIKNSNKQVLLKVGDTISIECKTSSEEGVYIVTKINL